MAARERVVFLVRCALITAFLVSAWGFHATYLSAEVEAERPGVERTVFAKGITWRYLPKAPGAHRAEAVVERFLRARREGDARAACRELTTTQRRVTAAVVSERPASVSEAGCERHILRVSHASATTSPYLLGLLERGFFIEVDGRVAVARPYARDRWGLEMVRDGRGRFAIDAWAMDRAAWAAETCGPVYGYSRARCACVYDEAHVTAARRHDPNDFAPTPKTVDRASRACA